jgi:hypothetical protein
MTKDDSNVLYDKDFEKLYELLKSYINKIQAECLEVMRGKKVSFSGQQIYLLKLSKALCDFTTIQVSQALQTLIHAAQDNLQFQYDPDDSSDPANVIINSVFKNFYAIKQTLKENYGKQEAISKC